MPDESEIERLKAENASLLESLRESEAMAQHEGDKTIRLADQLAAAEKRSTDLMRALRAAPHDAFCLSLPPDEEECNCWKHAALVGNAAIAAQEVVTREHIASEVEALDLDHTGCFEGSRDATRNNIVKAIREGRWVNPCACELHKTRAALHDEERSAPPQGGQE